MVCVSFFLLVGLTGADGFVLCILSSYFDAAVERAQEKSQSPVSNHCLSVALLLQMAAGFSWQWASCRGSVT